MVDIVTKYKITYTGGYIFKINNYVDKHFYRDIYIK